MRDNSPIRLCLFGAAPDTGNLGVSALCYSVLASLAKREPSLDITVFDHGRGLRRETVSFDNGPLTFNRCGAAHTRRLYRPECLWNIRLNSRLGLLNNPAVRCLHEADAILDLSGGDSFTDLYGPRRFRSVTLPKFIALEADKPLVLLPQTYGPYSNPRMGRIAGDIVRRAALAWARDQRSYEQLKELAGDSYDPQRHRCGVDVAFALERHEPQAELSEIIRAWLSQNRQRATIGFNVSGLIFNDPNAAIERYGFRADYRQTVLGFLRRVLEKTDVNVLLVPHVLTPVGHYESDYAACLVVSEELATAGRERLAVVPPNYDQSEMKWIIARLDWFCGTRMHATIAGLSSGVPTAAIAYSLKTQGVFECCQQGQHVADPRSCETEEMVERLWTSFSEYEQTKSALANALPAVLSQVEAQMDQILDMCKHSQPIGELCRSGA